MGRREKLNYRIRRERFAKNVCRLILGVKEYAIDTVKYDAAVDRIYRDAYYRAISGQDQVRTVGEGDVSLKSYWCYQGDFFMEDADYKPHKEDEDIWWDTAYWVCVDEELGMVQVDEKRYRELTRHLLEAVDHAVSPQTFEEIFGDWF